VKETSSKGNFLKMMFPIEENHSKEDGHTQMFMPRCGPKTEPTLKANLYWISVGVHIVFTTCSIKFLGYGCIYSRIFTFAKFKQLRKSRKDWKFIKSIKSKKIMKSFTPKKSRKCRTFRKIIRSRKCRKFRKFENSEA
jgi:hypothetical protein